MHRSRAIVPLIITMLMILSGVTTSYADTAASDLHVTEPAYKETTHKNLVKMYWRLGDYDLSDNEELDNFLLVMECDAYARYFTNTFQWNKLRQAARNYLQANRNSYPLKFTFQQPIKFQRYNFQNNGFPLTQNSRFTGSRQIQISNNTVKRYVCDKARIGMREGYALNAAAQLRRPFSLTFMPMAEDKAKKYLDYLEKNNIDTWQGRPAYLRMYIEIDQYVDERYMKEANGVLARLYGNITRYEVFADLDNQYLLYEEKIK